MVGYLLNDAAEHLEQWVSKDGLPAGQALDVEAITLRSFYRATSRQQMSSHWLGQLGRHVAGAESLDPAVSRVSLAKPNRAQAVEAPVPARARVVSS